MPPLGLAAIQHRIDAPALKACRANVVRSQLQIAQRAHKSSASLAASLKRFVGVKETGRLIRHRRGGIHAVAYDRPSANLQALLAIGTAPPSRVRLIGRNISA